MNIDFIKTALEGGVPWFKPGEYTEEDFRKGIKHSVDVTKNLPPHQRSIEELIELSHVALKMERHPDDENERLHLCEEIGDVIWAIGLLIERYNLSEETIRNIRKLKDEYEWHKDG